MKQFKNILLACIILLPAATYAQGTYTLQNCIDKVIAHNNISGSDKLFQSYYQLKAKEIDKTWLPGLQLNAQARYQSDVTSIDLSSLPFPVDIESPSKDQYSTSVDIMQPVYDGGIRKNKKEVLNFDAHATSLNTEQNIIEIKKQTTALYFGILQLKKQAEILENQEEILQEKLRMVKALVNEGVLLLADQQMLETELIKLQQAIINTATRLSRFKTALALQMGEANASINLPDSFTDNVTLLDQAKAYPPLALAENSINKIDQSKKLLSATRLPQLYLFAQLGYGKPALNFLSSSFDSYYIVGARLSWNIWDWNQLKLQKDQLDIQKQLISIESENISTMHAIELEQIKQEINNFDLLLLKDDELIAKNQQIVKSYESRMNEGSITFSDYLQALNMLKNARLNAANHILAKNQKTIEFNIISGKF